MTCSLANAPWLAYKACHDYLGILPLTTGSGVVMSSRQQLETAFRYHTNLWQSFPEYLIRLAQACSEELGRDAASGLRFPPDAQRPLSLARRTRTRSDEASVGATVFVLAEDCCYGVDTVTGEPLWRHVIDVDPPFFPVPVTTRVPALLLFDGRHQDLLLVDQRSGGVLRGVYVGGAFCVKACGCADDDEEGDCL